MVTVAIVSTNILIIITFDSGWNGRHYLSGLVSSGPVQCGTERGGVYVNVAHYLSWIRMAKLQDLVDDYKV